MDYLKILLNLDATYKNDFYEIKRRIINKILKDFNEDHCDVLITKIEYERVGRKIGKILFHTKPNSKFYKKQLNDEIRKTHTNSGTIYS